MILVLVGSPKTLKLAASLKSVASGFMARRAEATFRSLMHKTSHTELLPPVLVFFIPSLHI
jgi:hypothetical protein